MLFNFTDKYSKKTVIFAILTVFFVFADRFLKALCLKGFFDLPVSLVGDIFSLHYIKNPYIAFSLPFSGPIAMVIIGAIIIVLLLYWLILIFHKNLNFPLTLLIIGAILNFTDRVEYGFVIDYFDLKYFTIFNLADTMIVLGVLWLLYKNYPSQQNENRGNTK